jgi:hypothetical protein
MIVATSNLFKLAYDFRPPGKTIVEEYAQFIAHKSEKLGSAGQLPLVRKTLSGKIACSG